MNEITRQDIKNLAAKAYTKDLALYLVYYCREKHTNSVEVIEYALNLMKDSPKYGGLPDDQNETTEET